MNDHGPADSSADPFQMQRSMCRNSFCLVFRQARKYVMHVLCPIQGQFLYHRIDKKTPSLCRVEMNCLMCMTC